MILILHNNSHVGVVWDSSQWSVYTCERTACNSCSKEKIPAEIATMGKALAASIGEDTVSLPSRPPTSSLSPQAVLQAGLLRPCAKCVCFFRNHWGHFEILSGGRRSSRPLESLGSPRIGASHRTVSG